MTFTIKRQDDSLLEIELKPTHRKEAAIWLLYLLNNPILVSKYSLKNNKSGGVKVKIELRKIKDWESILSDTKIKVLTLINKQ